jgi:hypothetical protein
MSNAILMSMSQYNCCCHDQQRCDRGEPVVNEANVGSEQSETDANPLC